MSEGQPRGEGGEFGEKVSEQDILIAFDTAEDPALTAGELAEQFPVSRETIRKRLERMREDGLVEKKKTGARSAVWWSKVAPRLAQELADDLEAEDVDREDAVGQAEMKQRLGMND